MTETSKKEMVQAIENSIARLLGDVAALTEARNALAKQEPPKQEPPKQEPPEPKQEELTFKPPTVFSYPLKPKSKRSPVYVVKTKKKRASPKAIARPKAPEERQRQVRIQDKHLATRWTAVVRWLVKNAAHLISDPISTVDPTQYRHCKGEEPIIGRIWREHVTSKQTWLEIDVLCSDVRRVLVDAGCEREVLSTLRGFIECGRLVPTNNAKHKAARKMIMRGVSRGVYRIVLSQTEAAALERKRWS